MGLTRVSSSTSSAGMAHSHPHNHRNPALPHPASQISAREQYTPATPSFRRPSEHPSRSPSFPASGRRTQLSPTATSLTTFTSSTSTQSMGSSHHSNHSNSNRNPAQNNIPPLEHMQLLGNLHYADGAGTPAKVDINGTIDKGFFLSDNQWTCYRRNYFSCVCSFVLSPLLPGMSLQFTASGGNQPVQIFGFAMSISAVVADNEQHSIELVQHTPKRDKGPVAKPEKVRLGAKPQQPTAHHHHMNMFPDSGQPGRSIYSDNFGGQPTSQPHPTEHTFERIQFKQATQNNGKRRAAQQYYQLVIELWGDLSSQRSGDQYVKIATRRSEKMIVRGRSPGHYQNDRRGSQSSGPGGSAGNMGGYGQVSGISDFNSNPMMGPSGYTQQFDGRSVYGMRHHDIPPETMISGDESRAIVTAKEYQYYPSSMYEGGADRMDMFSQRSDTEAPPMQSGMEMNSKVKPEYDGATLPSIFHPSALGRSSGNFEGKPTSNGYYPTLVPHLG